MDKASDDDKRMPSSTTEGDKRRRLPLWPASWRPRRELLTRIAALNQRNSVLPLLSALAAHGVLALSLITVAFGQSFLPVALAVVVLAIAAIVCAVSLRGMECLVHGASHYDLFGSERARRNDVVADLLVALPTLTTTACFRRHHLPDHHAGFGSAGDPCRERMLRQQGVRAGGLPTITSTLRALPADLVAFYRTVGSNPVTFVTGVAWHVLVFVLPLCVGFGFPAGAIAWASTMAVTFGLFLPIVRGLAEAGEHDYGRPALPSAAEDSVFHRTFNNVGFANKMLHLFGDDLHVEHHMFPSVPQYRLRDVQALLHANDNEYRESVRTRHTVLGAPSASRPQEALGGRTPVVPANDNTFGVIASASVARDPTTAAANANLPVEIGPPPTVPAGTTLPVRRKS